MTDLSKAFDAHMEAEFELVDVDATMATMTDDPAVINVPTLVGGTGLDGVRNFYGNHFVGHLPPDTKAELMRRIVGSSQVVDEVAFSFTHTESCDFMLPGVAPTGRRIEIALVVIVDFKDGKVSSEHIYWDQASVLVQAGLLDPDGLPVVGPGQTTALWESEPELNQLLES